MMAFICILAPPVGWRFSQLWQYDHLPFGHFSAATGACGKLAA
jgi:hypothetical protein